jgi:hypothetical protein
MIARRRKLHAMDECVCARRALLPSTEDVARRLAHATAPGTVRSDTTALGRWESGLITRLTEIYCNAQAHAIRLDDARWPEGARRLIARAFPVTPREGAQRKQRKRSFIQQVGEGAQALWRNMVQFVAFLGDARLSIGRFAMGASGIP